MIRGTAAAIEIMTPWASLEATMLISESLGFEAVI